MLALVLLPTLGRLHPVHPVAPAFAALSGFDDDAPMCSVRLPGTPAPPLPGHPRSPHTDDECAYCPLLTALATPVVATWSLPPPGPMPQPARAQTSHVVAVVRLGHLGPRGPPAGRA